MLVPISLLILVLLAAIIGGLYIAKRRVIDNERPPDVRPNDRTPTSSPGGF